MPRLAELKFLQGGAAHESLVILWASLGMFVRMRTALPKVPCGSLDSVASTCDAPGTMTRRPRTSRRTVWEALS
ncbi:hypothetical protein EVAR_14506_1 [Eumeta japonica]|uniref:Uncharacterized protein n=1 Tax=Eumeta variegata TaxID=151549 RepID=A0A4C1U3E0_EUMVA|nr:hypothetical protein EVAR_14506_1 [Eumeta japonica]